jgi:tetratricopeptide (TPR) repeat protein
MAELLPEIARLSEILQKDPKSRLFYPLAEEYLKSNMVEGAVQVLTDGLQQHPELSSARVTLGKVYFEQGKFDEAKVELEQVLKSHPNNLIALRKLAVIYRRHGEWDKATRCCETVLADNAKDAEATQLLQDIESARAQAAAREQAIDLSGLERSESRPLTAEPPKTAPAPAPTGKTKEAAGESVWSLEVPTEVIERKPAAPPSPPATPPAQVVREEDEAPEELVSPTLAQLYLRQGHYEQAVRVYDELLRKEPNNDTYRKAHQMALTLLQGQAAKQSSPAAPAGAPESGRAPADAAGAGPSNAPVIRRLQTWLDHLRQQRRRTP